MDEPITDVVVVTSVDDCPHGYTIIKTTPCGFPANLWEKVFGGRSGERYICFTKKGGQNDTVIEDMIIPPPSQKYLRKGYRAISDTPDGEEPLRHKQLVLKRNKRSDCSEAIVDIVVYRSKDEPAHSFRKLAKVNDLYVCVRPAKISSTRSNTVSEPVTAKRISPVEENRQVNIEPVVESTPNIDVMLDKMDKALTINPEGHRPTEHQPTLQQDSNLQYAATTTTYPQTGATQSMPEPTSTYSSSQTTPSSYPMPDSNNYAGSSTQGATTYSGSTYSQTTYSMPDNSGYASSTQGTTTHSGYAYSSSQTTYSMPDNSGYQYVSSTQGTTTYSGSAHSSSQTTYSMPNSSGYANNSTQDVATYPGSGYPSTTYSNTSASYSNSNTAYSNPSGQYSGSYASSQYPTQGSSSYSSTQYSSNPYSNSSYSNASYSNPSNSYASAGYSGASYGGSGLPYSTNPIASSGSFSNQYPSTAGYSTQPPSNAYPSQQYPTGYQPPGYPPAGAPPTYQGYGGYPATGSSYGTNQSSYPPTTKHFSDDIGFGF